jgi:hypothetical protein
VTGAKAQLGAARSVTGGQNLICGGGARTTTAVVISSRCLHGVFGRLRVAGPTTVA